MKSAASAMWAAAILLIAISIAMPALQQLFGVILVIAVIGGALMLVSGMWKRR